MPFFSQMVYHLTEEGHCCSKLFQHTINFVHLLVSVTLEKREGACALFVQKTPDMRISRDYILRPRFYQELHRA